MAERATSVGSLTFLGVFAMFSPSPRYFYAMSGKRSCDCPRKSKAENRDPMLCPAARRGVGLSRSSPANILLVRRHERNGAINTILIIVNSVRSEERRVG